MTKPYTMPLTVFLVATVMSVVASAQPMSVMLVYQRAQLTGSGMSEKTIRTNAGDSYLVVANGTPDMLLRSYNKGATFELAAIPEDYVRAQILPVVFLWPNDKGAVFGGERAKTIGNTALSSADKFTDFGRSDNWPGAGAIGPIMTFDAGLALTAGDYTADYGRTWKRLTMGGQRPKCYSPRFGLLVTDTDGAWHGIDPATGKPERLSMIPSKYTIVRSTPGGTTIGFTETSIGWMGPEDSTFTEQDRFMLPDSTRAIPMQIFAQYPMASWRDTTVMCIAMAGTDRYVLRVGEWGVQTIALKPLAEGNRFFMVDIDEPGCLIGEQNSYGHVQRYILFDQHGEVVSHPAIHKATGFADASSIAWSDSATYVLEKAPAMNGHLYRIDHRSPDRLEHVGRSIIGENVDYTPMSICLLDTLNGGLIGLDVGGAIMEYTNEPTMRGFLVRGGFALLNRTRTTVQQFEFSKPQLITLDTAFVIGTTSAYIGSTNAGSLGYIWNEQNPPTMLQRSSTGSFYFGRHDVIQATLRGAPLDTISVVLPGEQLDRMGVLSDITEVGDQQLVVALRGHNTRTYTGDLLGSVRGGIAYTTDRGATWQRSAVPSDDQAYYSMQRLQSGAMLAVSVDADILVDSASSASEARCYGGHILRSTDGGITWTAQAAFSLRNELLTLCSYKIWQGSTGRIYVATPEAVFISIDDGVSFTAVNEFPLNCTINGVAEYNGQLHVATSLGIYRENTATSVTDRAAEPASVQATASRYGQAWRITVSGLPTSRIMGIDVIDLQGRPLATTDLWSQDNTASVNTTLPSSGVYGIVVCGPQGQRWTATVGIIE